MSGHFLAEEFLTEWALLSGHLIRESASYSLIFANPLPREFKVLGNILNTNL